jgi:hypothetical protein
VEGRGEAEGEGEGGRHGAVRGLFGGEGGRARARTMYPCTVGSTSSQVASTGSAVGTFTLGWSSSMYSDTAGFQYDTTARGLATSSAAAASGSVGTPPPSAPSLPTSRSVCAGKKERGVG